MPCTQSEHLQLIARGIDEASDLTLKLAIEYARLFHQGPSQVTNLERNHLASQKTYAIFSDDVKTNITGKDAVRILDEG